MRNNWLFVIIFLLVTKISVAQSYIWNGAVSTDFQVAANWTPARTAVTITDTLLFNAVLPINIINVANQTIGALRIASGTNTVTLSSNLPTNTLILNNTVPLIFTTAGRIEAGDFLTIQLGVASSFTITSGVFGIAPGRGGKLRINGALTIAGGTLDIDVPGTGGAVINGPAGSITYNSGTFLCNRAASIIWAANSNYYHGINGSAPSMIPAATWQAGSTCSITGMGSGTFAPTGFANINFSNLTWNCPAQSGTVNLLPAGSLININGTFTIAATGVSNRELRLSTGKTTVRTASYLQTGGILTLEAGADTATLTVAGDFSHTGGVFNGVAGAAAGTALIDLRGNVSRGANATWQSSGTNIAAQVIYQFSGTGVQSVNVAQGTWSAPVGGGQVY
ncbi:MAG: hypothetical protein WKI04_03460 [Ferruginibacter sp.]